MFHGQRCQMNFLLLVKKGRGLRRDIILLAAVRVTASDIRKVARNPGEGNLSTISRAMVSKYGQSLGDFIPGVGMLDDGATSLTNRLMRQSENLNITSGNSLRRKLVSTGTASNNETESP